MSPSGSVLLPALFGPAARDTSLASALLLTVVKVGALSHSLRWSARG
jgi:hypothetical protein